MQIDSSKLYPVHLVFVKPFFRKNFHRDAIIIKVEIPDLLANTTRTLNLPKTLDQDKAKSGCIFKKVVGRILSKKYSDKLLEDSKALANLLNSDLSGKTFLASIQESKDGNYIDLDSLMPMPDRAA